MKTAIVSGASGGIGVKIAETLVKDGYFTVALFNKNAGAVENLSARLEKDGFGGYLFGVKVDFTDDKSVSAALKRISDDFSHIDILVNCAGVDLYKEFTETTMDEWKTLFAVNLDSAFTLSKFVLPEMIKRKRGKIVNISSIWGISGGSMETAYSATKAAMIGLTKSLAKEVAPSGINVNCVCPGVIDTAMNDRFSEKEKSDLISRTPLGRFGRAEDIAKTVRFLYSADSDFITGEVITADGGFTL